ncbi:type VI secretion protein VasK [Paraburkholderia phytofirmans OLGA172]|uniref:Type VI secretion protein VasK n=1 Tax=Paraburkholderia phytofirmans OLGA172 TaxID=1417228 RepID=A0A161I397_9BURK|nr:ImcF-related family protein [Paraburkholderia phytofirmans]ANB77083.1 type VI secretion protein VasK [Paraburkholderia phytofirmans OLGA172]
MTNPTNNIKTLALGDEPAGAPGSLAIWGLILLAVVLAVLALGLVWLKGDLLDFTTLDARKTASLWILTVLVVVVILHLVALGLGAYSMVSRLFLRETGNRSNAVEPIPALKRDARLQYLSEELRTSHGWFWRYRMPWLLVSGADTLIETVAPGLKQAGVMHIADAFLVHAAPDGIEAALWRKQVRQLRRRRPVDGVVQVEQVDDTIRPDAELPRALAGIATDLGWAAPITLLHAVPATGKQPEKFQAIGALTSGSLRRADKASPHELKDKLTALEQQTGTIGVRLCGKSRRTPYLAEVSEYIGDQHERIMTGWDALIASKWLRAPFAGVMFAPVFKVIQPIATPVVTPAVAASTQATSTGTTALNGMTLRAQPASLLPTWQEIARDVRRLSGKRVGFYWPNALAALIMALAIGWCVAMTISAIGNRHLIHDAQAASSAALAAAPGTPAALRAQLALQHQIDMFEYRQQHGAPWYLRAGLNRNDDILDALWQPYRTVATRNLQRPVAQSLKASLTNLAEVRADALQSHDAQRHGYNVLKAYLMLAEPRRTDPAFLTNQIASTWSAPAAMSTGEWLDTSQRLASFYADHLKAHPEWRIDASSPIVTAARNTLANQIGLANADDTVYQHILDDAKGKYTDASLTTLLNGTDARGLFATTRTVPGIYTRAAWDGVIAEAIGKAASERHVHGDWVLSNAPKEVIQEDSGPAQSARASSAQGAMTTSPAAADADADAFAVDNKRSIDDLKARLTARYFAEYTAAWQGMLNSVQWQPAANLNGAIDQLTRLADAQTSPLIALMKSVQYQAQAGRESQALTDTLVRKAQSLIPQGDFLRGVGSEDKTRQPAINPLDKPFGPLLALMGDTGRGAGNNENAANAPAVLNGVSLAHFLTVATTMRLKLQQIAASPDAQAMAGSLAQAVFQGKLSELAQARDDAALTAASLGTAWAGFGDALFARPLDTGWQTILQPAAASLNEAWRASVATPFGSAFNGRYPFFDTNADASFAELGRYVRPDTGLIARFITTQLAGVLKAQGDQWVPNGLAPQALQFDPKFLTAIRQLSTLGTQLYSQGDAAYRFEIMALPSVNVTRTELSVDGKPLAYFNQQESWTALTWPGNGLNGRAALMWQMVNAGLQQAFDATGDWAFLRLLSMAEIKPLDSTRYELTWNQPDAAPLRYVLRTQVGAGPLDLLKLRGFRMPERIFFTQGFPSGVAGKAGSVPALPPLPPEMMQ